MKGFWKKKKLIIVLNINQEQKHKLIILGISKMQYVPI
jgi:hypothetical protein